MFINTQFKRSVEQKSPASDEIRRHQNGSIDLDHYVRMGRAAHGASVRDGFRTVTDKIRRFSLRNSLLTKTANL
ncbi:MAG: hypothetical protein O7A62_12265 [Alphaproteobacteria bacterium]|nr:hypothetical protein [Alphaproteobacteria bacterium]MCZ6592327.1 hypothetical protein [Alphaproteobacteria bacterium]